MEKSLKESFVVDTSAFLSLESAEILNLVVEKFHIITSPLVINELADFAVHDDLLSSIAELVLQKKEKFYIEESDVTNPLPFVSLTDNKVFTLAFTHKIPLITDDIKLARHAASKITIEFSTYFLFVLTNARILTKEEALLKLEQMRRIRDWRNNIIYIMTKEALEKL